EGSTPSAAALGQLPCIEKRAIPIMKRATIIAIAGAGAVLALRALRSRATYDFRDKSVLITGGSRGLGLVLARELAAEGARLTICARDPAELERARADLAGRGAEVHVFPCDVTERAQVAEWVRVCQHRFGRIDVLIN